MIPALHYQSATDSHTLDYLEELSKLGFKGDIEKQYASRLAVATDNSVYQQLPQAVIHPTSTNDVILIGQLASQSQFKSVTFSARGGGTGTNGQSLTPGIIVDLSRHMNQLVELNVEQGWVRVQSGMVKDQLNDILRPHGYFFSPDLSTSNRATIGGMVNTDASGQGSLRYGKTSDHVLSLEAVFADGSSLQTGPESLADIARLSDNSYATQALKVTEQVCREKRQQIIDKFPPLNRFLTGYDLKNAYDDELTLFDITRVLCGAEGSLAFITEAKLNITPIPKARVLLNIKYNSFDSALRNAPFMVEANALSVETIDSKVLNLARADIVWHSVKELITDVAGKEMLGINMVEFAGNDIEQVNQQATALAEQLERMQQTEECGVIG
ncbi:MAG: FAD-binding oxidoreductase, partial [Aliivibrio sp.]|uniref:FAD-binding oxidoreductase n=1 Tax=Aliivibrio sp. TaxID=1872443 RepID=UPI001A62B400|nr:FAD-binding oxidoreductase [Aliivibrio sp.]